MSNRRNLEQDKPNEFENIIQTTPFTRFVEKTAPDTKGTGLPQLAQAMVYGLSYLGGPDENGNFGIIRGGSMRTFLLDNYVTDNRLAKIYSDFGPKLLGEDPMAAQVINKVFSMPKDIDIFFRNDLSNGWVHQKQLLYRVIKKYLVVYEGYKEVESLDKQNETVLTNGTYTVKVLEHQTGVEHKQSLVKVNFSRDGKSVMKLHFGLIPDTLETEEDPRFYEANADIDNNALGYLSRGKGEEVLVRHFGLGEISYVNFYLQEHFFDPLLHPLKIDSSAKPDQVLMARLREINFRTAMYHWLFTVKGLEGIDENLQTTPFNKLFDEYTYLFEREPVETEERINMNRWFQSNENNLRDHFKLLASDLVYGLTANPFLFFLFASPGRILDAFHLGNYLDHESQKNFLTSLAKSFGGDPELDSLESLSMKYIIRMRKPENSAVIQLMKYLGQPQTVSAFLKLISY